MSQLVEKRREHNLRPGRVTGELWAQLQRLECQSGPLPVHLSHTGDYLSSLRAKGNRVVLKFTKTGGIFGQNLTHLCEPFFPAGGIAERRPSLQVPAARRLTCNDGLCFFQVRVYEASNVSKGQLS